MQNADIMNFGHFFKLNNIKSDLSRNIAFYDYIWLKDRGNGENGTPEYPVYLTISHDSIDFRIHYHEDKRENSKHIHKHLHNIILSLPLSANIDIKDGLTGALVEGYSTIFPTFEPEGSNYLFRLLLKNAFAHKDETDIHYSKLSRFYDSKKNNEKEQDILCLYSLKNEVVKFIADIFNKDELACRKDKIEDFACDFTINITNRDILPEIICHYFSKLHIWDSFDLSLRFNNKMQNRDNFSQITFNSFVRKLILDFMFDLEHTKVFQTSPHYEHISVKLKENFFFSALANKVKYYYYREIEPNQNDKNFFLENYFLPAEEQWIKSIMNTYADHNFTLKERGWFDNPEEEMSKIYKEDEINGIRLYEKIKQDINNRIESRLKKTTIETSKWQLRKYDLCGVLPKFRFEAGVFLILLALISIFLPLPIEKINTYSFILIALLFLFFIHINSYLFRIRKKKFINKRLKLRYSYGIHFFLPRLLGAIIAGWLMIAFASNILPQFYAIRFNNFEYGLKNFFIVLSLVLLTFIFIYDKISKETPYFTKPRFLGFQKDQSKKTFSLMYIAFCYSYFIGIVVIALIGTESIKLHNDYYYYTGNSINIELGNNTVHISPGFLLVFSIVAMFIGLFIDRIFDDRQITDTE